ncbi:hypothetical protein NUU61_006887 [Penicillium alfredii]|uniref:Glutathione hydrolase n=1 Tax=Penicillium alfredii TaxID=1506179 RepID=A0A9W9F1V7_9EURO|nr:uncharacterized protein NUU61_006887 [Penicillium alfredii]KAJ5092017.1 hypothetical protein NUU61_006887 [Penicillium alfredii]
MLGILSLLLLAAHLPSVLTSPLELPKRAPNNHADARSHPNIDPGKLGAVASESSICSRHGTEILKKGGNAADAVRIPGHPNLPRRRLHFRREFDLTNFKEELEKSGTDRLTLLLGMYHSGIGGGGFMLVRAPNGSYEFIDFRETAPAAAFQDIGVPGEVRGLEYLHKNYGSLSWSTVLQPAIRTARNGFPVSEDLVKYMKSATSDSEDFLTKDPTWAIDFAPNGTRLGLGDTITRKRLANTLETIANHGADAFYTGKMAKAMIAAVQRTNGTMTLNDLRDYRLAFRNTSQIDYRGYKITSTTAPSSGIIAMGILKVLETYKDLFSSDKTLNLSTHRLDEAIRFGYGERAKLGDPKFVPKMDEYQRDILKKATIDDIRGKISDTRTQNVSSYDPAGIESLDTPGTSYIAAADHSGLAISVTTTINLLFGSHVMVPETGIIMNNEMDGKCNSTVKQPWRVSGIPSMQTKQSPDFSTPGSSNSFGYIPSVANYIRPGKRPLSSITPAIVTRPDGKLFMLAGSAGGSRILTATVQNIIHVIDQGLSAAQALAKPRLHDQLVPNKVTFEYAYDNSTVAFMKARGHNVSWVAPGQSTAHLIRVLPNGTFDAAGEPRQVNSGGFSV